MPALTPRQTLALEMPYKRITTGKRTFAEFGSWSNEAKASGIVTCGFVCIFCHLFDMS
jgi:hypothetical protein